MLNQNVYITGFVRYLTRDMLVAIGNGEAVPMKQTASGGGCDNGNVEWTIV